MISKQQSLINSILDNLIDLNLYPTFKVDYDEDEELTTAIIEVKKDDELLLVTVEYETDNSSYSYTNKEHKCLYGQITSEDKSSNWLSQVVLEMRNHNKNISINE